MRRFLVVASVLTACASAARFQSSALGADVKLAGRGACRRDTASVAGDLRHSVGQGALADPQAVALVGDDGRQEPLQTEVLARWPDGSIRWLLVDFQVDLRRAGARSAPGSTGRAADPRRCPSRFEPVGGGGLEINTGPVRIVALAAGSACWTPCGWTETATARSPTTSESPAPRAPGSC